MRHWARRAPRSLVTLARRNSTYVELEHVRPPSSIVSANSCSLACPGRAPGAVAARVRSLSRHRPQVRDVVSAAHPARWPGSSRDDLGAERSRRPTPPAFVPPVLRRSHARGLAPQRALRRARSTLDDTTRNRAGLITWIWNGCSVSGSDCFPRTGLSGVARLSPSLMLSLRLPDPDGHWAGLDSFFRSLSCGLGSICSTLAGAWPFGCGWTGPRPSSPIRHPYSSFCWARGCWASSSRVGLGCQDSALEARSPPLMHSTWRQATPCPMRCLRPAGLVLSPCWCCWFPPS